MYREMMYREMLYREMLYLTPADDEVGNLHREAIMNTVPVLGHFLSSTTRRNHSQVASSFLIFPYPHWSRLLIIFLLNQPLINL